MHLGSLFTALASYLDARSHQGRWLLRIDDLDTPRNRTDSVNSILTTLEAFGLHWDEDIYYQSRHLTDYEDCLTTLDRAGYTYFCECSRKTIADQFPFGHQTNKADVYPGTCRNKRLDSTTPHAIRLKVDAEIEFEDGLQGSVSRDLKEQDGDFILKRKDGIVAYQFAVVIDDYLQNVNRIVRGCDLLQETPKQIYLHRLLKFEVPIYLHVPVIADRNGHKLSKQTLATAVDLRSPNLMLFELLVMLKQEPPSELKSEEVSILLAWAADNWRPEGLTRCSVIQINP